MLELTGFLGLTRIPLGFWAHTDLTDSTVLLCGWEISQMILRVGCAHADSAWFLGSHGSHRSHGVALWVGNLTDGSACGLARADSTLLLGSHGSHRSHGIALWVGNLTDGSACGLARTDSTLLLGSHGSHRSHSIAVWVGNLTDASVGGWLVRIPLCFWAHTDLTDPTVSLCGWEISQMILRVWTCVGSWGLHGARSHGLIFWTLRTNQTYRTNRTDWTFLKIIREICGICVRPRWTPCGRVTKLQKIVLFGGRFERFEKKVWKKLLH